MSTSELEFPPAIEAARRDIEFVLEPAERKLDIVYNPGDVAGSRTELTIAPWAGRVSFLVDESIAAETDEWLIEVTITELEDGELHVRYGLPSEDPILA
jgi:hypothetical protein